MTAPVRVQLRRTKGWRMPENTVSVARPTKWGNPWSVKGVRSWLFSVGVLETYSDRKRSDNCVKQFASLLKDGIPCGPVYTPLQQRFLRELPELRGKNLACWCKLDQPCHADVLLELANLP